MKLFPEASKIRIDFEENELILIDAACGVNYLLKLLNHFLTDLNGEGD
jgi:hypothetical protein